MALVGAPNSGKTTLYNWLTGSNYKTVNYPGATVEYSLGRLAPHLRLDENESLIVMDTPGTYSLHPKSADEEVTLKALYENPELKRADFIIVVVDGTQMSRHLQLAKQIRETGFPMVIALTMSDLLRKQDLHPSLDLLEKEFQCPVIPFDGLLGGGLKEMVQAVRGLKSQAEVRMPVAWSFEVQDKKNQECDELAFQVLHQKNKNADAKLMEVVKTTRRLDALFLHPALGLIVFVLIMSTLFTSIFWLATPLMDLIDGGFSALNAMVGGWAPGSLWTNFLANGIISSFAAVLVFVPQIFILFLGIGALESTGYLARAATLIDKPFSLVGMSGRSFVPVLSGFACAVPAMIATRNISSSRDRWITNFIIPLMTCSARLPVYALLLAFVFRDQPAWKGGLILTVLYFAAAIVGGIAAAIVNKFLPQGQNSFFMMELPLYRRPRAKVLLRQSLTRTLSYVKRAGPPIFVFAVIMWAAATFPKYDMENPEQKLEQSYAGQVGHLIEPLVSPMGVDWRVGIGLVSAFAAREVFVSSLAVTFNITDTEEASVQKSLLEQMSTAVNSKGEKIFTVASVTGLLIFFMIALQCMSTVAVSAREMGSMKFALSQLFVFNVVAYVLAVGAVQGLRALGIA
ncbi:MAG: ferrous iron transporter B [Bdellovibrionaceae bacterium]|nr:ferrous iron transporter B [Pseudobdellovibrionaceae bacterium]